MPAAAALDTQEQKDALLPYQARRWRTAPRPKPRRPLHPGARERRLAEPYLRACLRRVHEVLEGPEGRSGHARRAGPAAYCDPATPLCTVVEEVGGRRGGGCHGWDA